MLTRLPPSAEPGADLIRLVHQRSGGIPFFVTALTQSLTDAEAIAAIGAIV